MAKKQLTLALIVKDDRVLLLNRKKAPFMGQWNGFGGKIEAGETPEMGMKRELWEETGLQSTDYTLIANGYMEWSVSGVYQNRVYLFTATLQPPVDLATPKNTREGLLNFFPVAWAMQTENYGMVADLKEVYPYMLKGESHIFETNFEAEQLVDFSIRAD